MPKMWIFSLAAVLLLTVTGVYAENGALIAAALFYVVFAVIQLIVCRLLPARLEAKAVLPDTCNKSKTVEGKIILTNNSRVYCGCVKIIVRCTNLLTNTSSPLVATAFMGVKSDAEVPIKFNSRLCGAVKINIEMIQLYDILCLTRKAVYVPLESSAVTVLPQLYDVSLDGFLTNSYDINGSQYAENMPGYDISEIYNLREYEKGDSPRNIHWKLSSKYNSLIVKEGSMPTENCTLIIFNNTVPENPDNISLLAEVMVSLSQVLIENGVVHTVVYLENNQPVFNCIENDLDLSAILPKLLRCERTEEDIFNCLDNITNEYKSVLCFTEKLCTVEQTGIKFVTTDSSENENCVVINKDIIDSLGCIEI